MTDREKIRETFSRLHASDRILPEVMKMTENNNTSDTAVRTDLATARRRAKRTHLPRLAAAAACLLLLLGSGTAAYAANVGGIQRTIQIWLHGDQTNAMLTIENTDFSHYTLEYTDADGKTQQRGGGGIAIEPDGTERPLTEEEILEHLNMPEVIFEEDGTIWVYYMDQKLEITDSFENDFCFVTLQNGDQTWYLTVKSDGSYGMNKDKYPDPKDF